MTRRDLLRFGVASTLGGWLSGCGRCDAGFPPNMTMPVFFGYKDYLYVPPVTNAPLAKKPTGVISNPPVPVARVFYPSIDRTPAGAAILTNCEPFPLVLLVHGDCPGVAYDQWYYFAGELARAGYVVAITYAGGTATPPTGNALVDTASLQGAYNYMRTDWEYRDTLMASPNTAVIGHSYGGVLAAELATQIPIQAFVSLSGAFSNRSQSLLAPLHGPSLFMWDDGDDVGAGYAMMPDPTKSPGGQPWSFIGTPKHGVLFSGGSHADYLVNGTTDYNCNQGGCNSLVIRLSVDFTTTFLTKYLPPGGLTGIASLVPDSLIVRPQDLPPPPNQGSYAGGFLSGLAASKQTSSQPNAPCFEQIFWQTSSSLKSTYLTPS